MRSVVVVKHVPWPANSGEKLRGLGVVEALRGLGPVVVCGFVGPAEDPEGLRQQGVEVRSVPIDRSPRTVLRGLANTRSMGGARFWSPLLRDAVNEELARGADVLLVTHIQLAAGYGSRSAARYVVDMHNVESELMARQAARSGIFKAFAYRLEAFLLRRLERRLDADLVTMCTERDRATYALLGSSAPTVVVPNAWPKTQPLAPAPSPVAAFVALQSWGPNVDASVWLVEKVWPMVRQRVPGAQLRLVGRDPAPRVLELAAPDVVVTGTVSDLVPVYAQTRVALAPLLAGGGSRLKILEALAYGRPVVATTVGAEGLTDLVGRGVVIADDPEEMAEAIVELLERTDIGEHLGRLGSEAVMSEHGWDSATSGLVDHLVSAERDLS